MAKRKFRLPGVEELNKDQDRVLRLPENGQFLIVGGPGTGKSVVALLRAMKFADNKNYVFLTYNKVLNSATNRLTQGLESNTLFAFFNKILRSNCTPIQNKLQQDKDNNQEQLEICNNILSKKYGHDYKKIEKFLQDNKFEFNAQTTHLIIDEGQDMSRGYYDQLMDFGHENFFIVADQNQQITEENSSRQELTDLLGLEVKNVIELTQNYRNSYPIALVAQHFFTDIASPKPNLPASSKSALGAPILYQYQDFQKCIKFILREADRDPSNLIGVVVAKNEILEICKKQLKEINIELDNEKPNIQSYQSGQTVEIDFSKGGIVILNDKSIKGLEFDVVFVMLNGFEIYNNDQDSMRKRLYVMSSRAIKKLIFFQSGNNNITELLPDESILLRQELN
ncbi:MAG: AAA family ATPase [Methylococcales symbiont of Hymedesmia sp. n. MRB-2018]|nr:MAG: AAA family ATPase [Methylococcales symbiont of Hymedesmia sp. n. MRB-2018]